MSSLLAGAHLSARSGFPEGALPETPFHEAGIRSLPSSNTKNLCHNTMSFANMSIIYSRKLCWQFHIQTTLARPAAFWVDTDWFFWML
jgi:hypothetical protein